MENELISTQSEEKLLRDLEKIVESKKPGKILLSDYINNGMACMDFAMLYESLDSLQYAVKEYTAKGVKINLEEESISVNS